MTIDEKYMLRCLELAEKGAGFVAPNPLVGAVLVYENKIIGEGWHQRYGEAHAEVNCIQNAIEKGNESLISKSTLYVSLEPCAHFGKTPPCDQLIVRNNISHVQIGCRDPFPEVNGKGIEHLQQAGVQVESGILEADCQQINRRFFCFHQKQRPYIILKWAQTSDGLIGSGTLERWLISNEFTNKLVHRWRGEEAAVMVGSNTVRLDNPRLTNRSGIGAQPVKVIVDRQLQLSSNYQVFDEKVPVIILNEKLEGKKGDIAYVQLQSELSFVRAVCDALYNQGIQSVLVEGGAQILSQFIHAGIWDEARVITNTSMKGSKGVLAPELANAILSKTEKLGSDQISYYQNPKNLNAV